MKILTASQIVQMNSSESSNYPPIPELSPNLNSDLELKTVNIAESADNKPSWSFWTVFSSTFLTIFLAEIGDKTQLATLLITAESQSPWVVFAGASLALIVTSLLGVLIGYWLARRLSPKTLDFAVAILLLVITGLLLGDVISS